MAKTWEEMSKGPGGEREATNMTKKEYNAKHGFGKQGELEANRAEAAERAKAHTNKGTGPNNHYSAADNLSPIEQQMLERKRAKEQANAPKQQQSFDNPNSAEAIASRQASLKERRANGSPQQVYDASANEGYDQNLSLTDQHKQKHMGRNYMLEMQERGIGWEGAKGGPNGYNFDMTKGHYVPNEKTRQQRASMYDNMFMRGGSDKASLGDRNEYIHQGFDPLNGSFKYDPNKFG